MWSSCIGFSDFPIGLDYYVNHVFDIPQVYHGATAKYIVPTM